MKIGQYRQRQRCKHVELEQFWQPFASRGFVSYSWAFLLHLWFLRSTLGSRTSTILYPQRVTNGDGVWTRSPAIANRSRIRGCLG